MKTSCLCIIYTSTTLLVVCLNCQLSHVMFYDYVFTCVTPNDINRISCSVSYQFCTTINTIQSLIYFLNRQQECCYTRSGSLISTEDGRGGQTFFYHPRYERFHEKYDVLPKQWCCEYSDNCEYFYFVRPMDHCLGYIPIIIGQ